MIRKIVIFFIATALVTVSICCIGDAEKCKFDNVNKTSAPPENNKVRLSVITVDPEQLDSYNTFLKEEIEASMELEPGVLTLYAIAEKERPNHIYILEIYADETAYHTHLQTPHFQKYKQETLDMIQSLELLDAHPLIPGLKIK